MDEKVILSDQPSRNRSMVVWPLAAILIGAPFLYLAVSRPDSQLANAAAMVALVAIIIGDIILVRDQMARNSTIYMLTPTRVVRVWGSRTRYQQAVPLDLIRSVTVKQSPVGKVLGYGTITLETDGMGRAIIAHVPRPFEWEKAILKAMPHPPAAVR